MADPQLDPQELAEAYSRSYYENYAEIPYERNDHWMRFFGTAADRIVASIGPRTVLDAGCAYGFLVEALRDRGVDAEGIDISEYAISQVSGSAEGHCVVQSLLEPLDRRYDLITCIEVIEHLPSGEVRSAIKNLASATDRILLSSTPGHHDEPTHINVQPVEYWAGLLAEHGFYRDVDFDAAFLSSWAGLFVRTDRPPAEIVKDYERSEFRFRQEALALRQAVMRQHARISELEETREVPAQRVREELEEQLADLTRKLQQAEDDAARRLLDHEQELRIARDAAIGAEATLGSIRAQADMLQARLNAALAEQATWNELISEVEIGDADEHASEVERLRARVNEIENSTTWRLMWRLLAPYRRLRARR